MKTKVYNFVIKVISRLIPSLSNRRKFLDIFHDKSFDDYSNHAYDMGKNIGKHSYMGEGCWVYDKSTTIGNFCAISHNVLIGAGQHPLDFMSVHPFQYTNNYIGNTFPSCRFNSYRPVVIGNDVWIGYNVVIMDGVIIGDGAVIGSNAVVTRDIPAYAIAVGVPAKVVRYRFDEKIIGDFLDIEWWNLDEKYLVNLPYDDVVECINQLKKVRKGMDRE